MDQIARWQRRNPALSTARHSSGARCTNKSIHDPTCKREDPRQPLVRDGEMETYIIPSEFRHFASRQARSSHRKKSTTPKKNTSQHDWQNFNMPGDDDAIENLPECTNFAMERQPTHEPGANPPTKRFLCGAHQEATEHLQHGRKPCTLPLFGSNSGKKSAGHQKRWNLTTTRAKGY